MIIDNIDIKNTEDNLKLNHGNRRYQINDNMACFKVDKNMIIGKKYQYFFLIQQKLGYK